MSWRRCGRIVLLLLLVTLALVAGATHPDGLGFWGGCILGVFVFGVEATMERWTRADVADEEFKRLSANKYVGPG